MRPEKESKMLKQAVIVWLLFAAAVLLVAVIVFAAVYILKLFTETPTWAAAVVAVLASFAFVSVVRKFRR